MSVTDADDHPVNSVLQPTNGNHVTDLNLQHEPRDASTSSDETIEVRDIAIDAKNIKDILTSDSAVKTSDFVPEALQSEANIVLEATSAADPTAESRVEALNSTINGVTDGDTAVVPEEASTESVTDAQVEPLVEAASSVSNGVEEDPSAGHTEDTNTEPQAPAAVGVETDNTDMVVLTDAVPSSPQATENTAEGDKNSIQPTQVPEPDIYDVPTSTEEGSAIVDEHPIEEVTLSTDAPIDDPALELTHEDASTITTQDEATVPQPIITGDLAEGSKEDSSADIAAESVKSDVVIEPVEDTKLVTDSQTSPESSAELTTPLVSDEAIVVSQESVSTVTEDAPALNNDVVEQEAPATGAEESALEVIEPASVPPTIQNESVVTEVLPVETNSVEEKPSGDVSENAGVTMESPPIQEDPAVGEIADETRATEPSAAEDHIEPIVEPSPINVSEENTLDTASTVPDETTAVKEESIVEETEAIVEPLKEEPVALNEPSVSGDDANVVTDVNTPAEITVTAEDQLIDVEGSAINESEAHPSEGTAAVEEPLEPPTSSESELLTVTEDAVPSTEDNLVIEPAAVEADTPTEQTILTESQPNPVDGEHATVEAAATEIEVSTEDAAVTEESPVLIDDSADALSVDNTIVASTEDNIPANETLVPPNHADETSPAIEEELNLTASDPVVENRPGVDNHDSPSVNKVEESPAFEETAPEDQIAAVVAEAPSSQLDEPIATQDDTQVQGVTNTPPDEIVIEESPTVTSENVEASVTNEAIVEEVITEASPDPKEEPILETSTQGTTEKTDGAEIDNSHQAGDQDLGVAIGEVVETPIANDIQVPETSPSVVDHVNTSETALSTQAEAIVDETPPVDTTPLVLSEVSGDVVAQQPVEYPSVALSEVVLEGAPVTEETLTLASAVPLESSLEQETLGQEESIEPIDEDVVPTQNLSVEEAVEPIQEEPVPAADTTSAQSVIEPEVPLRGEQIVEGSSIESEDPPSAHPVEVVPIVATPEEKAVEYPSDPANINSQEDVVDDSPTVEDSLAPTASGVTDADAPIADTIPPSNLSVLKPEATSSEVETPAPEIEEDSTAERVAPSVNSDPLEETESTNFKELTSEHNSEPINDATSSSSNLNTPDTGIERPKSPWMPSFQVTTVGRGASSPDEHEKLESQETLAPQDITIATAAVSDEDETKAIHEVPDVVAPLDDKVTDTSGETDQPAIEPPQLLVDTTSLDVPPAEIARPWTPSYSVHSQGSPIHGHVSLEEEDAVISHTEDTLDQVSDEPELTDMEFAKNEEAPIPEEVKPVTVPTGEPAKEDDNSAISPITEELSPPEVLSSNSQDEPSTDDSTVPSHTDKANEVISPNAEETPISNDPISDNVTLEGPSQAPKLVVDTSDEIAGPSASHDESERSSLHLTPQHEQGPERPSSPSWVPSYSVSTQGSPLQGHVSLPETTSTDVAHPSDLAEKSSPRLGDVTASTAAVAQPDTHELQEQPAVIKDHSEPQAPDVAVAEKPLAKDTNDELPSDNVVEVKPQSIIVLVNDGDSETQVHDGTAEAPALTRPSDSPAQQEPPKSPWTPSYSVTIQGPGTPDETELDKLELLPQRILDKDLTTKENITHEHDIPVATAVVSSGTTTPTPVIKENKAVPDSLEDVLQVPRETNQVDVPSVSITEATSTNSEAGVESSEQKPFPGVESTGEQQSKSAKPSVSRLAPVDEVAVTTSRTSAETTSPRSRLESTTSSRFFPGGWFSTAAKVVDEGRTSLEIARGEFIPVKPLSPAVSPVGDVHDSPDDVSESSDSAETARDSLEEEEEEEEEEKRRWCVVM